MFLLQHEIYPSLEDVDSIDNEEYFKFMKDKDNLLKIIFIILVGLILLAIFLYIAKIYPKHSFPPPAAYEATSTLSELPPPSIPPNTYIKVINSCDAHWRGTCISVFAEPNLKSKKVAQLRNDMVFRSADVVTDNSGLVWYKVDFGYRRYPERIPTHWYIPANNVEVFPHIGEEVLRGKGTATSTKKIVVSISKQHLYAYDGDTLFMDTPVSTGYRSTPTPVGTFKILIKSPSRYMQAPQPGITDTYDVPGVPWNMYIDYYGTAIHGAYWHTSFGKRYSHGCINLPPDQAEKLYQWAELGMTVVVQN